MLSARAGEEGTIEGLEAGADDYLVKPFAARELLARVRANLELERIRRTRDQLQTQPGAARPGPAAGARRQLGDRPRRGAIRGSDEFLRQVGMSAEALRARWARGRARAARRPARRERGGAVLERARAAGRAARASRRRVRNQPGRLYRALAEFERDADGTPVRLRGSNQDITEQRAAEEALAAIAAEREAAARERQIAHELQRSLLPAPSVDPAQLEVATSYQAGVEGTEVGGDWYDVIELGAGRTALVIGDVMGRGVGAAAVMAQLSAAVRAYARLDLPPADVLEHLDDLVRGLGEEQIVTCVYAVYDPHDRRLTFANAGHLPPLLAEPGGGVRRLADGAGPPLGSGPVTMEESGEALPVGARLVLYTDGLVERRDRPIDTGIDELAGALAAHDGGMATLPAALVSALVPESSDDDVALLVACVREAADEVTASLPVRPEPGAVQEARAFVADRLGGWDTPEGLARDAVLLVSELVSNAILHGRPPIELRLRRTAERGARRGRRRRNGASAQAPADARRRARARAGHRLAAGRPLGHAAAARRQVRLVPVRAAALRELRAERSADVNWTLEVVVVPVADVDRAKEFYAERLGFRVDHDTRIGPGMRIVQLTPPGSGCSIVIGEGVVPDMAPGSLKGLQLVVPDIRAAREELLARGVDPGEVQVVGASPTPQPDPLDNVGFLFFSDRTATAGRCSRSRAGVESSRDERRSRAALLRGAPRPGGLPRQAAPGRQVLLEPDADAPGGGGRGGRARRGRDRRAEAERARRRRGAGRRGRGRRHDAAVLPRVPARARRHRALSAARPALDPRGRRSDTL